MALGEKDQLADISSQAQEYLAAICRMLDRHEAATLTELARELSVAPPSALAMLRRLEEHGLATYDRQAGAQLTARGRDCAAALRRRHRLAERLLTDILRIPWTRAHVIAGRFEHVIDNEVEHHLIAALDNPDTCPHGNPIDRATPASWRLLTSLAEGQSGRLCQMLDETASVLDYLNHLGLQPGARVTVCDVAPVDGALTVEIEGVRHALPRAMADSLLVESGEDQP